MQRTVILLLNIVINRNNKNTLTHSISKLKWRIINMPKTGDTFTSTLKKAHLEWGSHRHTSTRGTVYGEG